MNRGKFLGLISSFAGLSLISGINSTVGQPLVKVVRLARAKVYNSNASCYLTSLVFLPLDLDNSHPFWSGKKVMHTTEQAFGAQNIAPDYAYTEANH